MGDAVPQTPWDLAHSFSRMDVFCFTRNRTCRTIDLLARRIGLSRDGTRAPMQVRNGWRPSGRRSHQPAAPSKNGRFFVQLMGSTSVKGMSKKHRVKKLATVFICSPIFITKSAILQTPWSRPFQRSMCRNTTTNPAAIPTRVKTTCTNVKCRQFGTSFRLWLKQFPDDYKIARKLGLHNCKRRSGDLAVCCSSQWNERAICRSPSPH
jgi:hypothetical protein